MSKKLEGKIALVTGGSTGIGLGSAKELVAQGAFVYITGRRQSALDEAVKTIGSNVTAIRADSSKLADLDEVYEQIKEEKGRVDIVFANAGGGEFVPIGSITEEHYDNTFNNNVKGVVFTVQKALPLMPGWRRDHPQCISRIYQGPTGIQRLLCNQGRSTFVCPYLDD